MSSGRPFNQLGQLLASGAAQSIAFSVNSGRTIQSATAAFAARRGITDEGVIAGLAAAAALGLSAAADANTAISGELSGGGTLDDVGPIGSFVGTAVNVRVAAFLDSPNLPHPVTVTAELPGLSTPADIVSFYNQYNIERMTMNYHDQIFYDVQDMDDLSIIILYIEGILDDTSETENGL